MPPPVPPHTFSPGPSQRKATCSTISYCPRKAKHISVTIRNNKSTSNKNTFQWDAYRPLQWSSMRGDVCVWGAVCVQGCACVLGVYTPGPRGRHPPDPETDNPLDPEADPPAPLHAVIHTPCPLHVGIHPLCELRLHVVKI